MTITSSGFDSAAKKFFDRDRCAQRALDATGVPGMAVGVVFGDNVSFIRSYGVANLTTQETIDENTIFPLASVSKPITSTVVAALVGQGFLGWDDPVTQHLPDFKLGNQGVTIADLLAHCSGLPDHAGDLLEDIGYDRPEILRRLRNLPVDAPRTADRYTNFGVTAAAAAAAQAFSKKSGRQTEWEQVAAEQLYQRLGMTRTTSRIYDFPNEPNLVVGHQRFTRYPGQWMWKPSDTIRDPTAQSPAGGVRSCVADMMKWMRLHLGGGRFGGQQVVSGEALAKTHKRYLSSSSKFGLGWNVGQNGELGHSGGFLAGAATCVQLWTGSGVGIVALTNGEPFGVPEAVCFAFGDYLSGNELPNGAAIELWLTRVGQLMRKSVPAPKDKGYDSWVSDAPHELDAYCGTYKHEYFGTVVIKRDEGPEPGSFRRLKLALERHPPELTLRMWQGDTFVYQTFGENAVGLSAVEFKFDPAPPQQAARVCLHNLHYSATNPGYSETDPEAAESAWFSRT